MLSSLSVWVMLYTTQLVLKILRYEKVLRQNMGLGNAIYTTQLAL